MLELAIDTSTDFLSLALVRDGLLIGELTYSTPRNHMKYLLPSLDLLLRKAQVKAGQLERLIVGTGPGSFTGLRIGASCAQALAFALCVPVLGIPSFDAIALNFKGTKQEAYVVVDAKKGQIYHCLYLFEGNKLLKQTPYHASDPREFSRQAALSQTARFILAGDAIWTYRDLFLEELGRKALFTPSNMWIPRAKNLAVLAAETLVCDERPSFVQPIYLRSPIQSSETRKR